MTDAKLYLPFMIVSVFHVLLDSLLLWDTCVIEELVYIFACSFQCDASCCDPPPVNIS